MPVALALYRVAQEALTNVVRHAGASQGHDFSDKRLPVCYNGNRRQRPRDLDTKGKTKTQGLGLVSMRERIEYMGGAFQIKSSPGKGTKVRVKIPIEARP